MKKRYLINFCNTFISVLFFTIIAFLFVLSIYNTSAITADYTEYTFFIKDNVLRNIVIVLLFLIIIFILSKFNFLKLVINKVNNDIKLFLILKYFLLALIFLLSIYWVYTAYLWPEADQWSVQLTASEMRNNNFSSFIESGYLARYPFQSGLVLLSYLFSFVFGTQNFIALQIFNALMVAVFYKVISEIAKENDSNNIEQLFIISSAFVFPILIFYSYFIYGSIPGITFCVLSFKHFVIFNKSKNTSNLILCVLFTIVALLFKTNFLIYLIALVISAIIKLTEEFNLKSLILIVSLCLAFFFQSFVPIKTMEIISDKKLNNGLQNISWIAMGIQEGERAPGWYNGYINDSFAAAQNNSKKQKKIVIKDINNRINDFKDVGYAIKFLTKKTASQWNNPTFQVFWNLDGKIYKEQTRTSWAMFFIEKTGQFIFQKYLNIIQTIILFGVLIYSIKTINAKSPIEKIFFGLYFIGGFLFHILWEAKAQYTFIYFIPIIPYAINGYKLLLKERKLNINYKIIIEISFIVILLLLFQTNKFDFLNLDNNNYYNYVFDINGK